MHREVARVLGNGSALGVDSVVHHLPVILTYVSEHPHFREDTFRWGVHEWQLRHGVGPNKEHDAVVTWITRQAELHQVKLGIFSRTDAYTKELLQLVPAQVLRVALISKGPDITLPPFSPDRDRVSLKQLLQTMKKPALKTYLDAALAGDQSGHGEFVRAMAVHIVHAPSGLKRAAQPFSLFFSFPCTF
jgi:hypothetical protein